MKVAIIGASGFIGATLLSEALNRGHIVTAIVRHPQKVTVQHDNLRIRQADVTDAAQVAAALNGNEAVISSYSAHDTETYVKAINAIADGMRKAGIKRIIAVSGAGSLEVAPGLQVLDTPDFPAEWKAPAEATRQAYYALKEQQDIDWTAFSPAAEIFPGDRTGRFRLGKDQLLTDAAGKSKISVADYAIALLDELEHPQHIKARFTIAY